MHGGCIGLTQYTFSHLHHRKRERERARAAESQTVDNFEDQKVSHKDNQSDDSDELDPRRQEKQ